MRRAILAFIAVLCAALPAAAQTTLVTGQVLDSNGIPYANARVTAQLTINGTAVTGQPTVTISSQAQCQSAGLGSAPCQAPFQGTVGFTLDPLGNIPGGGINLQTNSLVTPSPTQWTFSISTPGEPKPFGTGPQTFSASFTIAGASQSVSVGLQALAPALTSLAGLTNLITQNIGKISLVNSATAGTTWCAKVSTVDVAAGSAAVWILLDPSANTGIACSLTFANPARHLQFVPTSTAWPLNGPISGLAQTQIDGSCWFCTTLSQSSTTSDGIAFTTSGAGNSQNEEVKYMRVVGPGGATTGEGIHVTGVTNSATFNLEHNVVSSFQDGINAANFQTSRMVQNIEITNTRYGRYLTGTGSTTLLSDTNNTQQNGNCGTFLDGGLNEFTSNNDVDQQNGTTTACGAYFSSSNGGLNRATFNSPDEESNQGIQFRIVGGGNITVQSGNFNCNSVSGCLDNFDLDSSTQVSVNDSNFANSSTGDGVHILCTNSIPTDLHFNGNFANNNGGGNFVVSATGSCNGTTSVPGYNLNGSTGFTTTDFNFQASNGNGNHMSLNGANGEGLFLTDSGVPRQWEMSVARFVDGGLDFRDVTGAHSLLHIEPSTTNQVMLPNAGETLSIAGSTSGALVVQAPAVAGTATSTLPHIEGCTANQVAETGAATVLTCTPVAAAGSYRVRFIMSVSAATAATLGWTITYTDSNGNAQTPTNLPLYQLGTATPALTFVVSAAGDYYGGADIDINNAATAIVVKVTFAGTSYTAKCSASVERVIN